MQKLADKTGEARKLAHPFHGPYRLLEADTNTAKIVRVDHPGDEPLLVSLCRLRRCPTEIGTGEFWPPDGRKGKRKGVEGVSDRRPSQSATTVPSSGDSQGAAQGVAGNEMLGDIEQATTTTSDGVGDTPPGDCQFMGV